MPLNILGLSILKKSDYEDLEQKYDEEFEARLEAEKKLRAQVTKNMTTESDLGDARNLIMFLLKRIEFQKELSQPRNPDNGRLAKDSTWPKVDNVIAKMVVSYFSTTTSELSRLINKFG